MTPESLLLMIVSIAIAVLPVWRSPMISSRWPRPIGIIESIALMPVCIGSFTGWRWTTPGALNSAGRVSVVFTSPLPSSGFPSGSTIRPSSASPTGTSSRRPVRFTWSPSSIWSHSPNSTAPTLSDSRLSASPVTSWGSSSSSIDMTLSRPCTREMPSATDSTVPTSDRSAPPSSRPWMRSLRMLVISSGLICMSLLKRLSPPACEVVRVGCAPWRQAPCCRPAPAGRQARPGPPSRTAPRAGRPAPRCSCLCPARGSRRGRPRSSRSPAAACSPRPTYCRGCGGSGTAPALGGDHGEVGDLLADLVERAARLGLDVAPRRGEQLLALLGRIGLGLVLERVGCLARADDDVLGLLARLPEAGAVLLEQLVGLALGALGVLDRLLDRPAAPVERLGDAREDELVEDQQRGAEQQQRPDHQPYLRADQEAAALLLA